ncbi:MAG: DUF3990 domain-containing protein [Clostridiales Family XIII bacterium]|jgi:hypothetical protein|nr:DUF3990 domain-containing protein [Clostridiales Family XIII bacterium]
MILYHGSFTEVAKPDYWRGREKLDFGRGFYTTPYREQALKWSERFIHRFGHRIISSFEFDETAARKNLHILEFPKYSEDWLDFVTLCRIGAGRDKNIDLIIGSVANDKVFEELEAYFNGYSDKVTAIKKLRYEEPNLQYCFANQEAMDTYLHFVKGEVIE